MKKIIILCSIISALFFVSCDLTGAKITQQFVVPETPSETTETETPSETEEVEETAEEPEPVPYITIYNTLDVEVFFELKEIAGEVAYTNGIKYFDTKKNEAKNIVPSISGIINPHETYLIFSHPSENCLYMFKNYYYLDGTQVNNSGLLQYDNIDLKFTKGKEGKMVVSPTKSQSRNSVRLY